MFDAQYAVELGIDLGSLPALNLSGVGGLLREAKLATIAVRLLGHSDLEVMIEAAFADDVEALHGNLLGLDVLEHFDFALSHHQRLGSLGRALT